MFPTTCENFIVIRWTLCAPVGQHWVLQLLQFLFLFLISKTIANVFTITCKNFIAIRWTVRAFNRESATPGTPASTIFNFLNFKNHPGNGYNNLWKFHLSRIKRCVFLYGTHKHTHTHTHIQIACTDIDLYIYIYENIIYISAIKIMLNCFLMSSI